MDFKIRNCQALKDTIEKMKKQLTECKKIFTNHLSDKGLISRIHKELLQLQQKDKFHDQKIDKGSEQIFLPRTYINGY